MSSQTDSALQRNNWMSSQQLQSMAARDFAPACLRLTFVGLPLLCVLLINDQLKSSILINTQDPVRTYASL